MCERTPESRKAYLAYQLEYNKRPEVRERKKAWRARPDNRAKASERGKRYHQATKDQKRQYQRYKWKTDPLYKLRRLLRGRLWLALRGKSKKGSGVRSLGCTVEFFKLYLESLFQPGMSWENWGEWHLDHIRPLAAFDLTDEGQLAIACNYKNLQPLWSTENLRKGSKHAV